MTISHRRAGVLSEVAQFYRFFAFSLAFKIDEMTPGKRFSISAQRSALTTSVPRRSDLIRPASRKIWKWCDCVDFGKSAGAAIEQLSPQPLPATLFHDLQARRIGERVEHAFKRYVLDRGMNKGPLHGQKHSHANRDISIVQLS